MNGQQKGAEVACSIMITLSYTSMTLRCVCSLSFEFHGTVNSKTWASSTRPTWKTRTHLSRPNVRLRPLTPSADSSADLRADPPELDWAMRFSPPNSDFLAANPLIRRLSHLCLRHNRYKRLVIPPPVRITFDFWWNSEPNRFKIKFLWANRGVILYSYFLIASREEQILCKESNLFETRLVEPSSQNKHDFPLVR